MIETALLLVSLSCPKTVMDNRTNFPWNKHDAETLEYAKKRCVQIYSDSPCVKYFKKWGKQDYSVICGAPENK
jgi:hypothetical protein